MSKRTIDFNATPFCPEGYKIPRMIGQGIRGIYLTLCIEKILKALVLIKVSDTDEPASGVGIINNDKVRKARNCGSQLLDFLLDNPTEIPSEWNGKSVLFLGVFFASVDDTKIYFYFPCLYQDKETWMRKMVSANNRDFDPRIYFIATIKD